MEIEVFEKKKISRKPKSRRSQPSHRQSRRPKQPHAFDIEIIRIIQTEAYLCAEGDGFRLPPEAYWLMAEKKVRLCF